MEWIQIVYVDIIQHCPACLQVLVETIEQQEIFPYRRCSPGIKPPIEDEYTFVNTDETPLKTESIRFWILHLVLKRQPSQFVNQQKTDRASNAGTEYTL